MNPHTHQTSKLNATDPVFCKTPFGDTNIPEPIKYYKNHI